MDNKKKEKLKALKFRVSPDRNKYEILMEKGLNMGQKLDALLKMVPDFETKQSVGGIKQNLEDQIISFKRLADDFDRGAKLQAENIRTDMDAKVQKATQDFADGLRTISDRIEEIRGNHDGIKMGVEEYRQTSATRIFNLEEDIQKVWLEFKRLIWLIDQISQPQGSSRIKLFLAGTDLGAIFDSINLIAGTGMTIAYAINTVTREVDLTFSSTGGGGGGPGNAVQGENLSSQIAPGNKSFTAAHSPNAAAIDVWVDGIYIGPNEYTITGTNITFTSLVPATEMFISYFYGLIVSMIVTDSTLSGAGTNASPLHAVFQPVTTDGVTIVGDGSSGNPLIAEPQSSTVHTDGITVGGDGSSGNPLKLLPGTVPFKSSTLVLNLTASQLKSLNIFNGNADDNNLATWTLPKASTVQEGIYEFLNLNTSVNNPNSGNMIFLAHSGDSFFSSIHNGGFFSKSGEVVRLYCDGVSTWTDLSILFRSYQT